MKILLLRDTETLRYAAEELGKYLEMMDGTRAETVTCGEGDITLGLLSDLGLSEDGVRDRMIDDLIDVRISGMRGYIAGSNERSVLMGVYNLLKSAGCRWVRPGDGGEYIPKKDMSSHSYIYRKLADYPFRGQCIEGAVSFEHVRDTVLWLPKIGMNLFMIEQIVPYNYMSRWYQHKVNTVVKEPEPPYEQYCEWCLELEHTVKKCGLQLHAMGHGALNEPFGVRHMISGQHYDVPEDVKKAFALVGGKRELYKSSPFFTQLCMSQEWVQDRVVNWLADYLASKPHIDFLHFWLADAANNHCECDECAKHTPTDLYVRMLNKLDAVLTERGNDAKIVFIMYVDTLWAPVKERFNNPDRFIMTTACDAGGDYSAKRREGGIPRWERNNFSVVGGMDMSLSFIDGWRPVFDGPKFIYEYWLYTQHFSDPGNLFLARRIANNTKKLHLTGFDGIMSDQTQRAYFPTAVSDSVIGEFLYDTALDTERFIDDYLFACYGEDFKAAKSYLDRLSEVFEYDTINTKKSIVAEDTGAADNAAKPSSVHGNLPLGRKLATVPAIVDSIAATVEKNLTAPDKCHAESWRILTYHGEYVRRLAEILVALAENDVKKANAIFADTVDYLSRVECEIHPYFDLVLFNQRIGHIISGK